MTASPKQQSPRSVAGQVLAARPLALTLPCAVLAFAALAATVGAQAPAGPQCVETAAAAPGFDSLASQTLPACIRITF